MSSDSSRARPRVVFLTVVVCLLPAGSGAQAPAADRVLDVPRLEEMPRIDGRLDEPVWARAAVARDFVQKEPRAGELATQPTEVRVFYSDRHLLVGARFDDGEASRIVASEFVRDADLQANDAFEIFLDTFRDGRNAFYFATNAVAAQRDALIRNEGEAINWEWDGVWHVACSKDARGWTAEIAIPFATLRFRPGAPGGWGLNFGRLVARSREESYWAPINRDWGFNAKWRVSGYGRLDGIAGARPGGRLQLKPFALGGGERDYETDEDADVTREIGLDAKVALTPTLVADLTLNTDFAQVEADQQQVNLTRFPLFFPEKREFFLENAGLFQIGERLRPFEPPQTLLFFSRRIGLTDDGDPVPLLGGARVTGKIGRYDLGIFDIVADETQIDRDTRVPRTNFAAARVKRDILKRSSIGALLLSKAPVGGDPSNQVVAADATVAPTGTVLVTGFAARSFTAGLTGASHAAGIEASYESDRGGVMLSYLDVGEDFNAEMGFVPRTGIRKLRGAVGIGRRPGALGIRQIFFGNDHQYYADSEGRLQSQVNVLGPAFIFNNGTFLVTGWLNAAEGLTEPFEIRNDVAIPAGTYRFNQAVVLYQGDQSRKISGRATLIAGGFYDGTLASLNAAARVRPINRLTLELELVHNEVSLPRPNGEFSDDLVITRATFAFSSRAFLRSLIQIDDQEEEARFNVLFRYTYRPGADLFVVYNEDRDVGPLRSGPKRRQLLVKLTVFVAPI